MTIGRSRKCDITINDPFLSAEHIQFIAEDEKNSFLLKDMGTTNGTLVNGDKLRKEAASLKDGDKISIGQLDFLYVSNVK